MTRVHTVAIAPFVLAAFVLGGWVVWRSAHASGKVESCYLFANETRFKSFKYTLMGYRQWRPDKTFGMFPTTEAALAVATKVGCTITRWPLETEPLP